MEPTVVSTAVEQVALKNVNKKIGYKSTERGHEHQRKGKLPMQH